MARILLILLGALMVVGVATELVGNDDQDGIREPFTTLATTLDSDDR